MGLGEKGTSQEISCHFVNCISRAYTSLYRSPVHQSWNQTHDYPNKEAMTLTIFGHNGFRPGLAGSLPRSSCFSPATSSNPHWHCSPVDYNLLHQTSSPSSRAGPFLGRSLPVWWTLMQHLYCRFYLGRQPVVC